MNLPTQAQVNAATRNIAAAAAGAIAMFGLSTKIDPATVIALINSLGTLTNDAIVVIGIVSPFVAAWYASRSARTDNQKQAVVASQPGSVVVETNSAAVAARVAQAISAIPEVNKVVASQAVADATPSEKVVAK
jgi:hypothetical protein